MRRASRTSFAGLATVAMLLSAAGMVMAKPAFTEQNDRLVLSNDQIVLVFQGKKPLLEVHDATNASRGYRVFLHRLVELPAGASLTGNQVVAEFPMTQAEAWNVSHTEDASGITIVLHRDGLIVLQSPRSGPPISELPDEAKNLTKGKNATTGNASVTITFRLLARAEQRQVGNATVNVTTHEVKFDLAVERWDWVSRADVLALEFNLNGPVSNQSAANATGGAQPEGQVNVTDNGTAVGWVGWTTTAQATYNGTAQNATVEHRAPGNGNQEGQGAKHWLVFNAPGFDRLDHDPTLGIEPTATTQSAGTPQATPGFVGPLLVLAAPAAALLLRRKR